MCFVGFSIRIERAAVAESVVLLSQYRAVQLSERGFTLFTNSEGRSHMINTWQYADARIWAGPEFVPKLGMLGFLEVYMQVKSQRQVRRK